MSRRPGASVAMACRLFGATMRLLPFAVRQRDGDDLLRMFAAVAREAQRRRGRAGVAFVWARSTADLLVRVIVERHGGRPRAALLRPVQDRGNLMQNLLHDVRQAVRGVARAPVSSLLITATLALGVGVNTAVFSVVHAVLLNPLGYAEPDRLVVFHGMRDGVATGSGTIAYLNFADVRDRGDAFVAAAAYDEWRPNLTGDPEPERIDGAQVNVEFFRVLGVEPTVGRFFADGEDRDGDDEVVVLSHGLWTRRFGGDPGIIGRTIAVNGRAHEVVGVAPPGFEDPLLSGASWAPPEIWRPLGYEGLALDQMPSRGSSSYTAIGCLAAGVSLETARAETARIMANLVEEYPDNNLGLGMTLVPLRERMVGDTRGSLLLLQAVVGLVLAIATINVGGLLLSRTAQRRREVAIRAALGAGTSRLARLLAAEILLLAAAAGLLGVGVARLVTAGLMAITAGSVPRAAGVGLDPGVLGFAALVSVAAGVLCALAPLATLRRAELRLALQPGGHGGVSDGGARSRRRLVVLQAALSVVLLTGALLLGRSLWQLSRVDTGFATRDRFVFELALPRTTYPTFEDQRVFMAALLTSLESVVGIESAATINILPLSGSFDCTGFWALDRPEPETNQAPCPETRTVSPSYFRTMEMELLAGRLFGSQDGVDAEWVGVINETFAAELWAGDDPLGRTIRNYRERPVRVVGVVRGVKHRRLDEVPESALYVPYDQNIVPWHPTRATVVVETADDPRRFVGVARERVRELDPELPVAGLATLDSIVSDSVATPRYRAVLVGSFAVLALGLAMLGIYGTVALAVANQRRDIAVRAALGARGVDIRRQVLWHGLAPVLLGTLLGFPAAVALGRLMASMLFQVAPFDPVSLVTVPGVLSAVACLATWAPARRAAADDPMAILRGE